MKLTTQKISVSLLFLTLSLNAFAVCEQICGIPCDGEGQISCEKANASCDACMQASVKIQNEGKTNQPTAQQKGEGGFPALLKKQFEDSRSGKTPSNEADPDTPPNFNLPDIKTNE